MTTSIVDPQFPQIAKALEPGYMQAALQKVLFGDGNDKSLRVRIESCRIGEKRYKPGKSFSLSYSLTLRELSSQNSYEQIVSAQLNPVGDSQTKHQFESGNPTDFLPEINMRVWAFPHDRSLPHLTKLLDKAWLITCLKTQVLGSQLSDFEQINFVDIKIMHYLPGLSCMIRYTLGIQDQSAMPTEGIKNMVLYGKNYQDNSGFQTYNIMQQIAEQTKYCAKALHYDTDTKTLWQAHLPGEPFEWLPSMLKTPDIVHKVANCIGSFQASYVKTERRFGYPEINQQLQATIKLSSKLDSGLGNKVKEIVVRLFGSHGQIDWPYQVNETPLHMDLKMGNLLISRDQAYLVDLDSVCLGDPLIDIGSFVANLYLNGLRAGSPVTEIDAVVGIFIGEYKSVVTSLIDDQKLYWYIAAALIHEVLRRSLRQHESERIQHTETYIEISHRYLRKCQAVIEHD